MIQAAPKRGRHVRRVQEKPLKTLRRAAWQRKEMHTKNGGGGIRTPETVTRLTVFKTVAFSRSATPPDFRSDAGSYARRQMAIHPARTIFGDDIELSNGRQPEGLLAQQHCGGWNL